MLATIVGFAITGLFGGGAVLAIASIVLTDRRHAGAWDALAAERLRLRQFDDRFGVAEWPSLVSTCVAAELPAPVAYQRRFNQRSTALPPRVSLRAAA